MGSDGKGGHGTITLALDFFRYFNNKNNSSFNIFLIFNIFIFNPVSYLTLYHKNTGTGTTIIYE